MLRAVATVFVLAVAVAGCACAVAPTDASGEGAVTQSEPESKDEELSMQPDEELQRRLDVRQGTRKGMPERVSQDAQTHVAGEVPESILQAIKEDLAARINAGVNDTQAIIAYAVTWSDGSLGCPRPDQMYTQALVPGYRVILEHAGKQYDYRASERGYFFLCEMPTFLRRPESTQ